MPQCLSAHALQIIYFINHYKAETIMAFSFGILDNVQTEIVMNKYNSNFCTDDNNLPSKDNVEFGNF